MNAAIDLANIPAPEDGLVDVYLSVGSNISPERYMGLVIGELRRLFTVAGVSSVWKTQAVGFFGGDFLNAVVKIRTRLSPVGLKFKVLRPLEAQLGRIRTEERFTSRTIDIDIMVYNDILVDDELFQQPHLAVPMAELYPDFPHPETHTPLSVIAKVFSSSHRIEKADLALS